MPLPFTHVLINTAIAYPFRKSLGKYWFLFAVFSGLLLDFDFVLGYLLKHIFQITNPLLMHGGFVHSFGFILFLGIISTIIYLKNKEYGIYFYILTIGSLIHLILDFILGGGQYYLTLFWPFTLETFRLHLLENFNSAIYGILDAFLIMCTIIYLTFKIKLTFKK
jgi:hypothetical protein